MALSRALEKAGIYAVVHGYNGKLRVGVIKDTNDHYRAAKLVNDTHRPKGYKSIFVNGKETLKDSQPSQTGIFGSKGLAVGALSIIGGIGALMLTNTKK